MTEEHKPPFTKGPWEVDFYWHKHYPNRYADAPLFVMADCEDWRPKKSPPKRIGVILAKVYFMNESAEETQANARLIAASPTMYALLKETVEHFDKILTTDQDFPITLGDRIRDVLGKVEGE